jgi:hypothetical protein
MKASPMRACKPDDPLQMMVHWCILRPNIPGGSVAQCTGNEAIDANFQWDDLPKSPE